MFGSLSAVSGRIVRFFSRAVITLVDDTKTIQFIQARINPLESVPNAPRFAEFGFTSNPPDGSEVLLAFGNGDRTNGIVIATSNAKYRMTGLASGEVAIHNASGMSVYLSNAGIVVDGGGLPITMTNASKIRAETALLECTGDIKDNCDTTGRSMVADRKIFDNHTHQVPSIEQGAATATTNNPTQQE